MSARTLVALCVAAHVALGCTIRPGDDGDGGGGTGGTGGSGGSGSAASECEDKVVCSDCRACAANGPCADALAACSGNSACIAIDECLTFFCSGTEAECLAQCESQNQAGVSAYRAARTCVDCEACPGPCGSALICGE